MKLSNILQTINEQEEQKPGTYAGVRFSDRTVQALIDYCDQNNIPNRLSEDKFHSTLLFSRKHLPDYVPKGRYNKPMIGEFSKIECWPSQVDTNCLIMRFKCESFKNRHKYLMNKHNATWDFENFLPHLTLSYDVPSDFDPSILPPFEGPIEIVEEYCEELDTEWAANN